MGRLRAKETRLESQWSFPSRRRTAIAHNPYVPLSQACYVHISAIFGMLTMSYLLKPMAQYCRIVVSSSQALHHAVQGPSEGRGNTAVRCSSHQYSGDDDTASFTVIVSGPMASYRLFTRMSIAVTMRVLLRERGVGSPIIPCGCNASCRHFFEVRPGRMGAGEMHG